MLRTRDANTRDERAAPAVPHPVAASLPVTPKRSKGGRRATTAEVIGRDPRLNNIVAGRDGIIHLES
ncbi:MAG: hypothetical protein ABSH15_04300 [Verrucomicrobiota bacterium]